MATKTYKSRILEEMRETACGLHEAGLVSKRRMCEPAQVGLGAHGDYLEYCHESTRAPQPNMQR